VRGEEKQTYHLGEFEGPLDLLLFLIKRAEINIYDIPIAEITEQYLEYLGYLTKKDLENLTEFYVMAATLLYIKSRMLLPVEVEFDDDFEDPRKELVDRLIEYQKFKKISELMFTKSTESEWVIDRTKKQRPLPFPEDSNQWEQLDVWDLLKTFSSIISNLNTERIIDLYEEVSINEKISLLYERLETADEFAFTDLIIRTDSIMEVVCAFLAVLESIKAKKISIFQNKFFGDIVIRRYVARTA
jgi:segregation and condensation protein A